MVEKAMAQGDAASPLARQVAERYRAMGHAMSGGDPALLEKIRAFFKEAQQDPELGGLLAVTPEMEAFIDQAVKHLD